LTAGNPHVLDDLETARSTAITQFASLVMPVGRTDGGGPAVPPAAGDAESGDEEPGTAISARAGMADPERQLWCAVIIHTLYEAAGRVAYAERGEHAQVRREAVAWFEEAGEDFAAVCDLAGFLPGAIRDNALKVIHRGRLPRMRIPKAG
jgi:hypothetical protein